MSSSADYAAVITALVALLGGVWAYLTQRAALAEERSKRLALEAMTARKDEFEHQAAIIETLQRAMEAQNTRHEKERAEWHAERLEWRQRELQLMRRIEELEAIVTPNRKRHAGPLGD